MDATAGDFDWDFGDGRTLPGEDSWAIRFDTVGTYAVTLSMTTLEGDTHTDVVAMEVVSDAGAHPDLNVTEVTLSRI